MKKVLYPGLLIAISSMAFAQDDSTTSSDDKERYTAIFTSADRDQDELLSVEEAGLVGLSTVSFESLDSDGDSYLTLKEFLTIVNAKQ